MESYSIYKVANIYKIPVISMKGISNNEVLGEEYDTEIGKKLQQFAIRVIRVL